ncbi:MAG: group 1 glycosyl transferase, partial [Parcubacteria group bacterium GW2011_GWC1_38_22]
MKLLLIKVGKAFKTIQREGILKGGSRVFLGFFALFRFVGKGDILFVTGGIGDSARYRTHHVAEELELHGFKCSITVQDNPLLANYSDKFSVFVFHRVLFTPSVKKMIEKIKKQGKEIIFETDDLVYDPKYLEHMDYFKVMNSLERKLYENGVGGEILADPYVKVCTTTTNYLADKLREHNKKVFIVPNKLSKKDVEIADKILKAKESSKPNKTIKIGYFSGAHSHNKDFATIT